MRSQHTPGPWQAEYNESDESRCVYFIGPHPQFGLPVASISAANPGGIAEANAARIVACINACAGMADPEVWIGMQEKEAAFAKTEIPRLVGQIDALSAENAQLREALAALTGAATAQARAAEAHAHAAEARAYAHAAEAHAHAAEARAHAAEAHAATARAQARAQAAIAD